MQVDRKPVAISCLILLGVFICCLCAVTVLAFSIIILPEQDNQIQPQYQPTPFDLDSLPTPTSSDNSSELPQDLLARMRQIQQEVIAERQLLPNHEIPRLFLTPVELRTVVEEDFLADYTKDLASLDSQLLSTFGLVEPDRDLLQFYQDLYSEQIAGYYDTETGEMKVVKGGEFGPNERITYAHEYIHVLQDQNFGIEENLRFNEENCENDRERCDAIQALMEGDATLLEYKWQEAVFTDAEFRDWLSASLAMEFPTIDEAGPYFMEELYFPYLYGLNFVSYLYERGGWEAVNAAYDNPPITTEQIMHPERYPDDIPQEVTIQSLSTNVVRPYVVIDEGEAGEWFTYQYLTQGIDEGFRLVENSAKRAVRGWDGGYYKLYIQPYSESILLITCNVWDDKTEANEFFAVFQNYGDLRWPESTSSGQDNERVWESDSSYSRVLINGTRTCWLLGPDQVTVEAASKIAMRSQ